MQQPLIEESEPTDFDSPITQKQKGSITTFRQCLKSSEGRGLYHRKIFFLIAFYSIFTSVFLSLPFFLFKKPIYCQMMSQTENICCEEGDETCISMICNKYSSDIMHHIMKQQSLTYIFQLFCQKDIVRVVYKIFPQTLCLIGFLVYGTLADIKGRKISMKISWRLYTVGVIIFSVTQAQFLKIFGYVLASIHCFPALIFQFILFFQLNAKKYQNRESLIILACLSVGPLILSIASQIITDIDNRILLAVLCAFPATILSVFIDKIFESPVCVYPYSKQKAFGIVNLIAKQNKKSPILIDLSRSFWHKYHTPKNNIIKLLVQESINKKILLGFFFMFIVSFTIKISQISLDNYTETQYRSIIVNIPTALADLSLCIFLFKIKRRTCRYMLGITILLVVSLLVCNEVQLEEQTMKIITIIHAVIIRYCCELCQGLLLIWSIETFPTICRGYCVGLIYCGMCFGVFVSYILKDIKIAYIIVLVGATLAVAFQGFLGIEKYGVMKDTLKEGYYDENDSFYRT